MKYPIALFCSLCMLLLWSACDSQSSEMDLDCQGEVVLRQALQDTSVYVGGAPLSLALDGDALAFAQTSGRHLTFSADSDESFVDIDVMDRTVQVTASQAGNAQIHVEAVDACEQRAETTFTIHFLDPCSPSPPSGEASFMPVQVGDTWIYDYTNYSRTMVGWTEVTADSGQVSLTAIAATCSEGQRIVTLQQQVQIERTSWTEGRTNDSTWVTQIDEEETVQLIEYADGRVLHPFATEPFMRFHPATSDTVRVDAGGVRLLKHDCGGAGGTLDLSLTQEQGVAHAHFRQCLGSAAVSDSGDLELVSFQPTNGKATHKSSTNR